MPTKNMNDLERAKFVNEIVEAIHETMPSPISNDEAQWVRMAIKKEAQSIEFRKAVIEKTTGALIVAAMIFVGGLIWTILKEYGINHGFKP